MSSKSLRGKVVLVNFWTYSCINSLVAYPTPIDSKHSIWQAFRNEYWPADYFVDTKGLIRYHHFGEGEYEKSERVIQTLRRENGVTGLEDNTARITADGPEAPPSDDVRSPETYAGYARADGTGEIRQPRMYQLIRQKGSIHDVTFEIEFLDPSVEVFSFMFG